MTAKQLMAQLARMKPNTEVYVELDGVWRPLRVVELGVMSDTKKMTGSKNIVRLVAKAKL